MSTITEELLDFAQTTKSFTTGDAYSHITTTDKPHSIRARIYEMVNSGVFTKLARGVYAFIDGENTTALMIQGDGRDLSMLDDNSVSAIITDHPYEDTKSNQGGNRSFANYDTFRYTQADFNEKARVLKDGGFLVEFFAEENANNFEYIYQCKQMAQAAGLRYYACVDWHKEGFVANTGRKSKDTEQLVFFTKGKPRSLRLDAKATKATLKGKGVEPKPSDDLSDLCAQHRVETQRMSGTDAMLPARFSFAPPSRKERIHQAQKPLDLLKAVIGHISQAGEVIVDQFAGSGSTIAAALSSGRNAIGIELDSESFVKASHYVSNFGTLSMPYLKG